jgi:hypothetical protein
MKRILWPFWLQLAAGMAGVIAGIEMVDKYGGLWWVLGGIVGGALGQCAFDGIRSLYSQERARRDGR